MGVGLLTLLLCFLKMLPTHIFTLGHVDPPLIFYLLVLSPLSFIQFHQIFSISIQIKPNPFNFILNRYKFLSSSHILILEYFELLDHMSQINQSKSLQFEFLLNPLIDILQCFGYDVGLFIFELEWYFAAPFYWVAIYTHVIEILVGYVVVTVTTWNWLPLIFLLLFLLLFLLFLFLSFQLLLLCFLLVLIKTSIGNIHTIVIEQLAKWHKISRTQKWTKTSAHSMYIYPLVSLPVEIFFITYYFIFLLQFLKSSPFLFKMLPFFFRSLSHTFVNKIVQLHRWPKWHNIYLLWKLIRHLLPNIFHIFWHNVQQIRHQNSVLPCDSFLVKFIRKQFSQLNFLHCFMTRQHQW